MRLEDFSYYKDHEVYTNESETVCYIPENAESIDDCYSRNDFIKLCGGDEIKAHMVFDICSWEHPATVLSQWDSEDENALEQERRTRNKKAE